MKYREVIDVLTRKLQSRDKAKPGRESVAAPRSTSEYEWISWEEKGWALMNYASDCFFDGWQHQTRVADEAMRSFQASQANERFRLLNVRNECLQLAAELDVWRPNTEW